MLSLKASVMITFEEIRGTLSIGQGGPVGFLTGQTPHGVLMSPVTGSKGLSTLNSFFCPFDDDLTELLSATSDISALPSKTNVFKIVSISPSDS